MDNEGEEKKAASTPQVVKKLTDKVRQSYVRLYGSLPKASGSPTRELEDAVKRKKAQYQQYLAR